MDHKSIFCLSWGPMPKISDFTYANISKPYEIWNTSGEWLLNLHMKIVMVSVDCQVDRIWQHPGAKPRAPLWGIIQVRLASEITLDRLRQEESHWGEQHHSRGLGPGVHKKKPPATCLELLLPGLPHHSVFSLKLFLSRCFYQSMENVSKKNVTLSLCGIACRIIGTWKASPKFIEVPEISEGWKFSDMIWVYRSQGMHSSSETLQFCF